MTIYYFSRDDLEDALGLQTVNAIFDETATGQPSDRAVAACCAYGTSECNSFLRANYPEPALPTTQLGVPDELKFAALDFGCAYATRRRPDLVRAMGEESWTTFQTSAIDKMKRYVEGLQRLPLATGVPENVQQSVTTGPEAIEGSPSQFACIEPER